MASTTWLLRSDSDAECEVLGSQLHGRSGYGAVTSAAPEELLLILKTLNANAFNFAKSDVGVGVHTIKVEARATASVNLAATSGSLAGAQAFTGAGSLLVEKSAW